MRGAYVKLVFCLLILMLGKTVAVYGEGFSLQEVLDIFRGSLCLTDLEQSSLAELNRIVVNIPSFELFACKDNEIIKVYKVSLGRIGLPTPEGIFTIDRKIKNPHYIPLAGSPNKKIADYFPPGENNPMGTRKMHFYGPIYIHGLPQNKRRFIGKTKNGSCVALLKEDIEELFDYVAIGTKVEIYYKVNKVIFNGKTMKIELFPDLYNGFRRKVTEISVFPPETKCCPVLYLPANEVSDIPLESWKLNRHMENDTLLVLKNMD